MTRPYAGVVETLVKSSTTLLGAVAPEKRARFGPEVSALSSSRRNKHVDLHLD